MYHLQVVFADNLLQELQINVDTNLSQPHLFVSDCALPTRSEQLLDINDSDFKVLKAEDIFDLCSGKGILRNALIVQYNR